MGGFAVEYVENSPFYRLLATKYEKEREQEALDILEEHPELARLEWPGPDEGGRPFVWGSTALHYAANDGKLKLIERLVECGADPNASNAAWYQSVLSWAANNAQNAAIGLLLGLGARADSKHVLHAAAFGGSSRGKGEEAAYAESLRLLVEAGADINDRRHKGDKTPLAIALESGNAGAIEFLRARGAAEQ